MTDELEKLPQDESTDTAPDTDNGAESPESAVTLPEPVLDSPADEMPIFDDDMLASGDLDIDAALAGLASLQEIVEEEPAEAEQDSAPVEDDVQDEDIEIEPWHYADEQREAALITETYSVVPSEAPVIESGDFFRPPPLVLQRGQAASVIPAVLLMAAGGWLTYLLMTGATLPAGSLMGLGACGIGVILLAQWFTAGRWTRGSFFMGSLLTLVGGVLIVLFQPNGIGLAGFPGLIIAAGVAFALTALLTKPRSGQLLLIGLALFAAGLIAIPVLTGALDASILNLATTIAPVILLIVAVILVIPLLRRRR